MQKKSNLTSILNRRVFTLFVLLILFIGNSCKKDNIENPTNPDIENLKNWYQNQTKNDLSTNLLTSLSPNWQNTKITTKNDSVIYEIDLNNPKGLFVTKEKIDVKEGEKYSARSLFKLLIIKNLKTNITRGYYMNVIASNNTVDLTRLSYKKLSTFTGDVNFYSLDGTFLNGWGYNNGKIVKERRIIQQRPILMSGSESCTISGYPIYARICFEVEGSYESCFTSQVGTSYTISCSGGGGKYEEVDVEGGEGSPDGNNGGSTVNNPVIMEVKQDSLQKHYPCMVKEVLNKLLANNTYGKLIQPFQNIQLPNGSTLFIQGLPNLTFGFSAQPYGGASNNYMLGNTIGTGRSSEINFNSSAINNASQLFLQAAAIHEVAHAYSTYYVKTGAYGHPVDTTKYSTWAMNIVNFGAAASSQSANGNYTDHSLFLENYVDNFIKILKDINGNNYTDKQYQMTALYGLNNPGVQPPNSTFNGLNLFNIYKSMLDNSYNNLLTKYGITPAQRDAFYLDNLINVSINLKLPTNCPN